MPIYAVQESEVEYNSVDAPATIVYASSPQEAIDMFIASVQDELTEQGCTGLNTKVALIETIGIQSVNFGEPSGPYYAVPQRELANLLQTTGDAIAALFDQLIKGEWVDSMGHPVATNKQMHAMQGVLKQIMEYRTTRMGYNAPQRGVQS